MDKIQKEIYSYKVFIRCYTYNQQQFISDALNGFIIQKTTFPFVAAIVDDASTDNTPSVIIDFLREHFELDSTLISTKKEKDFGTIYFARHKTNQNCYFAVILLKENHYSQKRGKYLYFKEWSEKAEYHALCEGDDYWTDPLKLQCQVDFLETHPSHTMVCNRTKLFSLRKNSFIEDNRCYTRSRDIRIKDIIQRGGLFISTCSLLYRKKLRDNSPLIVRRGPIGDYPLQITLAIYGKCYYMDTTMSVYRVGNEQSRMGIIRTNHTEKKFLSVISEVEMLQGFASDYPEYNKYFNRRICTFFNHGIFKDIMKSNLRLKYAERLKSIFQKYKWWMKIDLYLSLHLPARLSSVYTRFIKGIWKPTYARN